MSAQILDMSVHIRTMSKILAIRYCLSPSTEGSKICYLCINDESLEGLKFGEFYHAIDSIDPYAG